VRRLALALVVLAAAAIAVAGTGASDEGRTYKVRAIFDNAVSTIPGEDVRIAGVNVGKIDSLDVTADKKAAIVLSIDKPGFQDFRQDARCTIRPQSLIGEKFVECTPTEPRAVGEPPAPPLRRIEEGHGEGQYLLPLERTSTPVDLDLVNNVLRRPYAERLSIVIGELGTALAGRGDELAAAIRRSNPALQQTDRVLAILARQNRVLADLARDSDAVLGPLARERRAVGDQFAAAGAVARASAERGDDLERDLELLPTFLRELRPTMARLGALSDQATPVFADLGAQAPAIDDFVRQLGPFSRAAIPALRTLGEAGEIGGPALQRSRPTIRDLRTFASGARPLARNLALLLDSLHDTGGVERLMDYIFYQATAVNGFDQYGHYLRAGLLVNLCTTYAVAPASGCSARFEDQGTGSAAVRTRADRDRLASAAARLAGVRPAGARRGGGRRRAAIPMPSIILPGRLGEVLTAPSRALPPVPEAPAPAAGGQAPAEPGAPAPDPGRGLLDYLLGGGA
jgi:ABC-type transporter Mla subunit MlaD